MPTLLTDFDDNFYLTYPHNNGFADGGRALILGKNTQTECSLWKCGLDGLRTELCRFALRSDRDKTLWSDTAFTANQVVTIAGNKAWIIDLDQGGKIVELYAAPADKSLHPLPSIRADGRQIVIGLKGHDNYQCLRIDLDSGEKRILFEKPWMLTHFHFCPFDPEWIAFCHEGNCAKVMDRVWAWHPEEAPEGRCYFDQMAHDPQRVLYVGHERWSFHDRSVLIVAYGEGPARPRGIYEAFTDGRSQRLVSEGDRDMHLDVSRDGRWVAIDTSGAFDAPGKGWEDARAISDILVADRVTGERRYVARSRIMNHPSHPHPVFSPDGRYLYYNEASEDGTANRIWRAGNPFMGLQS